MCSRVNSVHRENADTDPEMGQCLGPGRPRGGFAAVLEKDNVEDGQDLKDILEGKSTRSVKSESNLIPKF